jgi:hypothetical protein
MSTIDESGATMADSDINSTHPDGSGNLRDEAGHSTAQDASGDDAARGNLDGSNAVAEPRDRSLDQAGGNGSFDSVGSVDSRDTGVDDATASDAGDSGQDNGRAE